MWFLGLDDNSISHYYIINMLLAIDDNQIIIITLINHSYTDTKKCVPLIS